MEQQPPAFYTLKQAAKVLGFSPRGVYSLVRQGQIRVVRFGTRIRVTSTELQRLAQTAKAMDPVVETIDESEIE